MKLEAFVAGSWRAVDDFHAAVQMVGCSPPSKIRVDGVVYINAEVHGQLLGSARAQATKLRQTLNADTATKLRSLADWMKQENARAFEEWLENYPGVHHGDGN